MLNRYILSLPQDPNGCFWSETYARQLEDEPGYLPLREDARFGELASGSAEMSDVIDRRESPSPPGRARLFRFDRNPSAVKVS
jgi:hypothetical protein